MSILEFLATVFRYLFVFTGLTIAVLLAALLIIARLPSDNPLKRILHALSLRVAATLAAGVVAIPIEPIPGLDAVYDVGALIALGIFWFTFVRDAAAIISESQRGSVMPKSLRYPGTITIEEQKVADEELLSEEQPNSELPRLRK